MSGNGVDIAAVYQLLREVADRVIAHDGRFAAIDRRFTAMDGAFLQLTVSLPRSVPISPTCVTHILIFGPPGVGKSHLGAALGHAMVDAGYRVLFTRTTDLVQHLQAARQDLKLATAPSLRLGQA